MNASLAIVAIPNTAPVWLGRGGVAFTPLRLPVISDWQPGLGRDPGRGDAVTGNFASVGTSGEPAIYLPATGSVRGDLMAEYLCWRLTGANGQFVNYYA